MISVLVSWMTILGIALILGYGFIHYIYKSSENGLKQIDVFIVSGLMILNVYAEIFSLFYKVGAKACLGLVILGTGLLIYYGIFNREEICKGIKGKRISIYQLLIGIFIIIATAIWTVGYPQHYDTSLYHYQAIRWIEEYGVVPGLGNLHNRFAYNSAFMPLQALFSFEWLVGQSLHTVNGFICCFFMIYAVISNGMWKLGKERAKTSDLLKVVIIIYICYNRNMISSPSSDTFTLLLIMYICTKWSEFVEKNIKEIEPYGYLCILCVYAISLKLSAAACVVLILWPAVQMVIQKRYRMILKHIVLGIIVLAPWLARNVEISGYLLYPYPQLDLFDVDWKMPASVLTYDSREVMVWGRNLGYVEDYTMPIWKWFPQWFVDNSPLLISIGLIAEVLVVISLIRKILTKEIDIKQDVLGIYSLVSLTVWMFTAPLMRYGMVYLMIPICICIPWYLKEKNISGIVMVLLIPIEAAFLGNICDIGEKPSIWQEDYEWKPTEEVQLENGIQIWIPTEGDQCSADVFPCVPYKNMVEKIELRGKDFSEGFRIKEKYKELHIQGYGNEW